MPRPKIVESPEQLRERQRMAVLVRMLRAALGWSQRDLGSALGVSHGTIAQLEQGRLRLNQGKLTELLALFEQTGLRFRQTEDAVEVTVQRDTLAALVPEAGLTLPVLLPAGPPASRGD